MVPWPVIRDEAKAVACAEALPHPARLAFGRNPIGSALLAGKRLIETNDHEGWRKVNDLSSNNANNFNGHPIESGRAEALALPSTRCRSLSGLAIHLVVNVILPGATRNALLAGPALLSWLQKARTIWPRPSAANWCWKYRRDALTGNLQAADTHAEHVARKVWAPGIGNGCKTGTDRIGAKPQQASQGSMRIRPATSSAPSVKRTIRISPDRVVCPTRAAMFT